MTPTPPPFPQLPPGETPPQAHEPLGGDMAFAAITAAVLTGAALHALQTGQWLVYAALHAALAGLSFAWARGSGATPRRQSALLAISIAFLGPLGAAGSLLCMGMEAWFRPTARGFMAWYDDLFPEEEVEAAELLLTRLQAGGDPANGAANLVSFMDAVTHGTIEQKQAVVALIARRFSPAFAPALRRALEDAAPAVRVQAAAAAAAIEARFAARGMALEREASGKGRTAAKLKELGRLNAELANSGLLESARADAARDKALSCYRDVLQLNPADAEAMAACGELMLAQGDAVSAARHLAGAMQAGEIPAATGALFVEAMLRQGRLSDLRAFARAARGRFTGPDQDRTRLDEALRFWAAGGAA